MNAKYRAPAIASDQYALLKIGAMAIRKSAVDHKNTDRSRGFSQGAESFQAASTMISSYKEEDCTQFGREEQRIQFGWLVVVVEDDAPSRRAINRPDCTSTLISVVTRSELPTLRAR